MNGVENLAAVVVQAVSDTGVSERTGVVAAVNAGPPKSLDVTVGGTLVPGVRYAGGYNVQAPQAGDVVVVRITRPGGSGRCGGRARGGSPFVIDKIAV